MASDNLNNATRESNPFNAFKSKGFTRLCPIIPPEAPIHPKSSIAKLMAKKPEADPRGKAPGVYSPDGWMGYDFVHNEPDQEELDSWARTGAGVGVKTGRGIIAVDVDTTNPVLAEAIVRQCKKLLGEAPIRYGRHPKALLVYRTDPEAVVPFDRVYFESAGEPNPLVEVLTDGRQFVAHGVHPKTGEPYKWPEGLPDLDMVPKVTAEQVAGFMALCEQKLPKARRDFTRLVDRDQVDQDALRGRGDVVADAIKHLPNNSDEFPGREDYLKVGIAIKAAMGSENEDWALELFQQWCARWDGGHNDPAEVEADWRRMRPPFSIGKSFLYSKAEKLGGWKGRIYEFFDKVEGATPPSSAPDADDIFDIQPGDDDGQDDPGPEPINSNRLDFDSLESLPPREWLYGTKVSRRYVTMVASPGGVGKSSWASLVATACASGEQLLHDKPIHKLKVLIYNQEDDELEMKRRMKAIFMEYGLGPETAANIFLLSGRDRRLNLLTVNASGELKRTEDAEALASEILHRGIDLVICDPLARCHSAPENDNGAQDEVMNIFTQIAHDTNCGIILVHHFKKGGEGGSMDSMRGASALSAGARSVLTLTPMSKEEAELQGIPEHMARHYVRLDDAKNNMAPARKAEWFRLKNVNLGNGNELYPEGDNVQCVTLPDFSLDEPEDPNKRRAVLEEAKLADLAGEPYAAKSQAKSRWIGQLVMEHFPSVSRAQVLNMLEGWKKRGFLDEYKHEGRWAIRVNSIAFSEAALAEPAPEQTSPTASKFFKPLAKSLPSIDDLLS